MEFARRDVERALESKLKFDRDPRDHNHFVLAADGKKIAHTWTSSGGHGKNIGPDLQKYMASQMRLQTISKFKDAVNCPLSCAEYFGILKDMFPQHADALDAKLLG
jgi:hypothetical protein